MLSLTGEGDNSTMKQDSNRFIGDRSPEGLRVAVWSPNKPFEQALQELIRPDAASVDSFSPSFPESIPDCVQLLIVDVDASPNGAGALIGRILSARAGIRIVAVSAHSNRQLAARALEAGALGYVLKETAFEDLSDAVLAVAHNQRYVSSGIESPQGMEQ
jgi:DNA-binding NarL/FixJ family response regulator